MHRYKRIDSKRIVSGMAVCCLVCSQVMPAFATNPTDNLSEVINECVQSCNVSKTTKSSLDFTGVVLHTHNIFCYDANKNLICPLPQVEEHEHSDDCYEELMTETEAVEFHTHSAECYTWERVSQICSLSEQAGHSHIDACYALPEPNIPEPHIHTDSCYSRERRSLTCIIPEHEGHTHVDSCIGHSEELICITADNEEHTHSDVCYGAALLCGQEATTGHTHGDDCYEWVEMLTCNLEEVLPDVDESDLELICTEQEQVVHTHSDECFEWAEVLSCGKEETSTENIEPPESEKVLVCTKVELKSHAHEDSCYETDGSGTTHLICSYSDKHQHHESCLSFSEDALICGLAEDEEHKHSYRCYSSWSFRCEMPDEPKSEPETEPVTEPETEPVTELVIESTSAPMVEDLSDSTADVESKADWEKTFDHIKLNGAWSYDLIAVAQTQLGYKESKRNFVVYENGDQKGYTRYGEWYGYNYADWCAMFVSFCLHYAGVEGFPHHHSCDQWIAELNEANMYATADIYTPKSGDIVFFDYSRNSITAPIDSNHVGIVTEVIPATQNEPGRITTIEGNKNNSVCYVSYSLNDLRILGYGILPDSPVAVYSCGLEAHTHDLDYYAKDSHMSCQLQEHIHNKLCRSRELQYEDESLQVDIVLSDAVYLPKNLELHVELIPDVQNQHSDAVAAVAATMNSMSAIHFCRMELLADGQLYQLPAGINTDVQIHFTQPILTSRDATAIHVFALNEEETNADSAVNKLCQVEELPVDYYMDSSNGLTRLCYFTRQLLTVAVVSSDAVY